MPKTDKYSGDSGKHSGGASGGSTGVPQADGGLDSGGRIALEVPAGNFYTRAVAEQSLTSIERENIGKPVPFQLDGNKGFYLYENSPSDMSRTKAKSDNETYPGAQKDTRRDFSKGHGASAPTNLSPEIVRN